METTLVQVKKVNPVFEPGPMVAAVSLQIGPVVVHAKLVRSPQDSALFLSMPARRGRNNDWYALCSVPDRQLRDHVQRVAVEAYQARMAQPAPPALTVQAA